MDKNLEKFMTCIKGIPLREKFVSCKDLKESSEFFKVMLNGCSYEEYENFFKNLMVNSDEVSDDELENIAGGTWNFKNFFTPLAVMTVFAGATAGVSFAAENSSLGDINVLESQNISSSIVKENSDVIESEEDVPLKKGKASEKSDELNKKDDNSTEELKSKETKESNDTHSTNNVEKMENKDEKSEDTADDVKEKNFKDNKNTTQAEVEYSLKFIEKLPKEGEEGFDKFLKLQGKYELDQCRLETIKEKGEEKKEVELNEKDIYEQMQSTVDEIIEKVKSRTPSEGMTEDEIITEINNRKISKHYKLPEELRITKGIYRWVAKNISYDFKSIEKDDNGEVSFRKPQDAIFVYNLKSGVCEGYARLTNLMMRMAKIPSSYILSINGENENFGHAFNAVYIDNKNDKRGWTLIDSTWGAPTSNKIGDNEALLSLMENKFFFSGTFNEFENHLNREDDYEKEFYENFENIDYDRQKNLEDSDIEDLNQRAKVALSGLNAKYKDGTKFEKVEFSIERPNDNSDMKMLNLHYKTNLTKEETVKCQKDREEQQKRNEINGYIKSWWEMCDMDSYEDLSEIISDDIRCINEKKDSELGEKSESSQKG